MDHRTLERLLDDVAAGRLAAADALERLRGLPYEDLGFARIDHHRALRQGFPEVVFGEGKRPEQIAAIVRRLAAAGSNALVTRVGSDLAVPVLEACADLSPVYHEVARVLAVRPGEVEVVGKGTVLVVAAGTSDLPVAEEAAVCAAELGNPVERLYDVGVAGVHRLLDSRKQLLAARVLVVVAGMEGALPSVVGGLVARPVIAVPTSVGYGAAFGGLAALLGMLTSCAAGVTVVNIDNGFGAAYAASLINRL